MKAIDPKEIDRLPGTRIGKGGRFSFHCHEALSCFNQCCRNLNLFLYPYDIIRLSKALGLTADDFLERFVDVVMRDSNHFPDVLLRMAENEERTCPFLTDANCSVYPDRPGTCRTFPVETGMLYDAHTRKSHPVHFYRPPDFCLGRHEKRSWTVDAWSRDQGGQLYNRMTKRWAELKRLFQADPWGGEGPEGRKGKMAFMATYNMTRFREFVFGSTFLLRYRVGAQQLKRMRDDDRELLEFGFDWVAFFLWGIKSKRFRVKG